MGTHHVIFGIEFALQRLAYEMSRRKNPRWQARYNSLGGDKRCSSFDGPTSGADRLGWIWSGDA
jgi:hypothetical protein